MPIKGKRKKALNTSAREAAKCPCANISNPYEVQWAAPASPFGLLEEELYSDPWRLLVGCLLLNKTNAKQVRKVIWELFTKWPSPQLMAQAMASDIQAVIHCLGLGSKRTQFLKTFSEEYLTKQWQDPKELTGLGQYASDAYFIFCKGEWNSVTPSDKELSRYVNWLKKCNDAL